MKIGIYNDIYIYDIIMIYVYTIIYRVLLIIVITYDNFIQATKNDFVFASSKTIEKIWLNHFFGVLIPQI